MKCHVHITQKEIVHSVPHLSRYKTPAGIIFLARYHYTPYAVLKLPSCTLIEPIQLQRTKGGRLYYHYRCACLRHYYMTKEQKDKLPTGYFITPCCRMALCSDCAIPFNEGKYDRSHMEE